MSWLAPIAAALRRAADRMDPLPRPEDRAPRRFTKPHMEESGAKALAPGPELLKAVRIAFIRKGTSLNAWCERHRVNSGNVSIALRGGWRGPKGRAVVERVVKAAGIAADSIRWDQ